jgi:hypothetical protein
LSNGGFHVAFFGIGAVGVVDAGVERGEGGVVVAEGVFVGVVGIFAAGRETGWECGEEAVIVGVVVSSRAASAAVSFGSGGGEGCEKGDGCD